MLVEQSFAELNAIACRHFFMLPQLTQYSKCDKNAIEAVTYIGFYST
jgi:hypothetical protein